jgi:hypothetical protein
MHVCWTHFQASTRGQAHDADLAAATHSRYGEPVATEPANIRQMSAFLIAIAGATITTPIRE